MSFKIMYQAILTNSFIELELFSKENVTHANCYCVTSPEQKAQLC